MEAIVAAFEAGDSSAEVARKFRTSRQNAWLWHGLLMDDDPPPPRRCPEVAHALSGATPAAVELVSVDDPAVEPAEAQPPVVSPRKVRSIVRIAVSVLPRLLRLVLR
jgi:hypothetical protein